MDEKLIGSPDDVAGFKAEKHTALRFDFDLEDIIAGNIPDGECGRRLVTIVENVQELPTQGKIEAALLPLHDAMTADFYRQEGGTGQPPAANRQSVREHAVKVIQARKVKKTALLRAAKGHTAAPPHVSPATRLQLIGITSLVILIAVVLYFKS